jgi:hypothetical protein
MIRITCSRFLDDDTALAFEPIRLGQVPSHLPTPDLYVLARDQDDVVMRIDVYADVSAETFPFTDAVVWREWIVIGFGYHAYLVALHTDRRITMPLEGYFGHLYPGDAELLIASEDSIVCISPEGTTRWKTSGLGVDGVIINIVQSGVVHGEGEWDPPGGWRPFTIRLDTGEILSQA